MLTLPDSSAKKILLIDDEKDLLDLLETVLRKEGFQNIYKAETAHKGMEICEREKPDLIVLDIMLPDCRCICERFYKFQPMLPVKR